VKPGQKVTAISPDWRSIYAPEILVREPVSPATDIYMAARCMFYLMGISPTQAAIAPCPLPMFRFLRACLLGPKQRIQNTWQVHEDFRNILTELYGERKFRTFSMPTLSATT